jgi:hypothetical protein
MKIPSSEFLDSIERLYRARFPERYRQLCKRLRSTNSGVPASGTNNGQFIIDMETFQAVNAKVGGEQWGDYEQTIAGKQHSKNELQLWGGLLPFYLDEHSVYGFSETDSSDEQVYVWSVHTIVHVYPSLEAFAKANLNIQLA